MILGISECRCSDPPRTPVFTVLLPSWRHGPLLIHWCQTGRTRRTAKSSLTHTHTHTHTHTQAHMYVKHNTCLQHTLRHGGSFSAAHTPTAVNTICGTSVTAADCSDSQPLPTKPKSAQLSPDDGGWRREKKESEREDVEGVKRSRSVNQKWESENEMRERVISEVKWGEKERAEDLTVTVKEREREAVTKGEKPGEQRCSEGGFNQRKWDEHAVVGCYLHKLGWVELEGGCGNVYMIFSLTLLRWRVFRLIV